MYMQFELYIHEQVRYLNLIKGPRDFIFLLNRLNAIRWNVELYVLLPTTLVDTDIAHPLCW